MFKKGDIVICIDSHRCFYIKKNHKYVIENGDGGSDDVRLKEIDIYYRMDRFQLLSTYREQKFKRILK